MQLATLPALGQPLDTGLFAGITTQQDGTHCAVVLLPEKPSKRLNWQDATAWADGLQATLPTRPVAALLFATQRPQFDQAWHWTCETHELDDGYAWFQLFGYGYQDLNGKSYEGHARAVRLIQLTA